MYESAKNQRKKTKGSGQNQLSQGIGTCVYMNFFVRTLALVRMKRLHAAAHLTARPGMSRAFAASGGEFVCLITN